MSATAALQLVEQQRLALDAPIQDTLREFYVRSRFHSDQAAADRDITLRRLLSHQSGLPSEHLRDVRNSRALPVFCWLNISSIDWLPSTCLSL